MAEPKPLFLAHDIQTRDGGLSKDSKLVNCYVEESASGKAVHKRPGIGEVITLSGSPQIKGVVNIAAWPWFITPGLLVPYPGIAIPSVSIPGAGYERFDALSDVPQGTSLLHSTAGLWVALWQPGFGAPTVTVTRVTASGYPTNTVPGIVNLDGAYYVMTALGAIYGSAIDAPASWNTLNQILLDPGNGYGRAICRHLNYILAFGSLGCQLFYDAGNATGSPLLPVQNAAWQFGCLAPYSVRNISDATIWVSGSRLRAPQVVMMEGTQIKVISTPYVEKVLQRYDFNTNEGEVGAVSAVVIRVNGHHFYVLSLGSTSPTLAFDLTTGHWAEWTSADSFGSTGGFNWTWTLPSSPAGRSADLIVRGVSGEIGISSQTLYTDNYLPIRALVRTAPWDAHTLKRKFLSSVSLIADNSASTVQVRWSDDDYETWSEARTLDMSKDNKTLQRCGSARRRAWELLHVADAPFRVYLLETEVILGAG